MNAGKEGKEITEINLFWYLALKLSVRKVQIKCEKSSNEVWEKFKWSVRKVQMKCEKSSNEVWE